MPRFLRISLFLLTGVFIAAIVCVGIWVAGLIAVGIPFANDVIGQPSPLLDPMEERVIALYLAANSRALRSPIYSEPIQIEFDVLEGETASDIVNRLRDLGLVRNSTLLSMYLRYRGYDRSIEVGSYALDGGMTIVELAEALQNARPPMDQLTIPEGWRLEQIAAEVERLYPNIVRDAFLTAASNPPLGYTISDSIPPNSTLEGFLFPDTYLVTPEMTAEELVNLMIENFEQRVADDIRQGFNAQGITLYEGVVLASIVEREAVIPAERELIASTFLNRIRVPMKLEADPTIQYALGLQTDGEWWKSPLTRDDLAIDSPYNTYLFPGLPPSPIANPGLDSLRAVAFPAATDFYYFQADCSGSGAHNFAVTFEEHLMNSCE